MNKRNEMKFEQIENIVVTSEDLAKLLPIKNRNYISELVRDHKFPRVKHNQYPLVDFIKRYVSYLDELCEDRLKKIREENTRSRLERANAEIKELALAEKRGGLLDAELVSDAWLNEMAVIVSELETFPTKAAPNLLGIKSTKDMINKLVEEINKVRTRIAKLKIKIRRSLLA